MSDEAKLPQKFAEKGILIAKDVKIFGRPVVEYNRGQLISIIGMMVDKARRDAMKKKRERFLQECISPKN